MKLSSLQMIAILCILAAGFITVAPLIQTAEAHGESHWHEITIYEVIDEHCNCCGLTNRWLISSYDSWGAHADNEEHVYNFVVILDEWNTDLCFVCALTGSCESSS